MALPARGQGLVYPEAMGRSALILAALAADAASGYKFRQVRPGVERKGIDSLQLWDESANSFELKVPSSPNGERDLAVELRVLKVLAPHSAAFPFDLPHKIGESIDQDGTKALLFTLLGGSEPDLSRLNPGVFSSSLAQALAAIHSLPPAVVRDAGLPDFDSASILNAKVEELDRIAATGKVPSELLSRWEQALEDVALFRFHPTVVHGSINSDSLLLSGQQVVGITGWSNLKVSDPAEDFSWLLTGGLPATVDDVFLNYRAARQGSDENLMQRAALYSELSIGNWLVYCIQNADSQSIEDAEAIVDDLRIDLEAGNLRDLKASSFVGLGTATSLLPEITSVNTAAIEIVSQPEDQRDAKSDDLF